MRVPAEEDEGARTFQKLVELLLRCRGEDAVAVRPRRTVEATERYISAQLQLDGRLERAQELYLVPRELLSSPLDDAVEVERIVIPLGRQPVEQPLIRVPPHDRAVESTQGLNRLAGLGAAGRDVAEADESTRPSPGHVGQDGLERHRISVDVGDHGDAGRVHSGRTSLLRASVRGHAGDRGRYRN